jgi:hypothetical protein
LHEERSLDSLKGARFGMTTWSKSRGKNEGKIKGEDGALKRAATTGTPLAAPLRDGRKMLRKDD